VRPFAVFDRTPDTGHESPGRLQDPAHFRKPRDAIREKLEAMKTENGIKYMVLKRHLQSTFTVPFQGGALWLCGMGTRHCDHTGIAVEADRSTAGGHPLGRKPGG
jgi:hypothetical protein